MAIFINPSEDINELLDLKYATVGDEVELMDVNGTLQLVIPNALPSPPPYSCKALVNTRGITNLTEAWAGCTSITEFPLLDFASCVNFESAWEDCSSLVDFPAHAFDNSQCSNYTNSFTGCGLSQTSVDNILISLNNSGVTNGTVDITGGANSVPSSLGKAARTSLIGKGWTVNVVSSCDQPPFNCSTDVNPYCVTNFSSAWQGCSSLESFPLIDTSSGINFDGAWLFCNNLKSFSLIDTSNGTQFGVAWRGCSQLTSFPLLNTSKGINFGQAWTDCYALTSFPLLDTSKGTNFSTSWTQCSSLTSFPALDLNKGQDFASAWTRCYNLVNFPANMFDTCTATNFYNAWTYCKLSQQSVDNILVSLDTAGRSNGIVDIYEGTSAYPSSTGVQAMNNLVSRGWTVSVNVNNYIPYPQDFQNWQITSGSITTNAPPGAPTGIGVADRWTESTQPDANGQRRLYYDLGPLDPPIVGTTCTLSIYVSKWGSTSPRNLALTFDDQVGMKFDLTTPSNNSGFQLAGFYNYVSSKVETISSQWYKCTLVFELVAPIGDQRRVGIRMLDSNLNENYTGDGSRLTLYRAILTN